MKDSEDEGNDPERGSSPSLEPPEDPLRVSQGINTLEEDHRIPPGVGVPNLETIVEGEVLDIADTHTPRNELDAKFYIEDTQSELDGGDRQQSTCEDGVGESLLDLPAELPPPPDGGWGWVIVVMSFLCNMTVDGIAYAFSPFLETFSVYFGEPQGKVAWISSLLAGVYLSAGPIVSALANKFGCRVVCVVGGIVGAVAYASTVFAQSVEYLMITQGVLAGFGFGLIYLPAVVAVGYYFESKRALATGIAVCGSGFGTIVFPPLVNYLIGSFGWQGTNLLLAGLILQCCVFGSLMRPLEVPRMKKATLLQRLAQERKVAMETGSLYGSSYLRGTGGPADSKHKRDLNIDPGVHSYLNLSSGLTPNPTLPTIEENQNSAHQKDPSEDPKESLIEKQSPKAASIIPASPAHSKMPRNRSQPAMTKTGSPIPNVGSVPNFERRLSKIEIASQMKVVPATPQASYTNLKALGSSGYSRVTSTSSFGYTEGGILRQRRPSREKRGMMLRPMSRQDIFYSGSIQNLQEFKTSQSSMLAYRESTLNLQGTGASKVVLNALDGVEELEEEKKTCCPPSLQETLVQMMDFSLLKNPVFLVICFANMIGMLGFYTPFVYLPGAAMAKGIDKESAMFLVSIIGITNTVGRVLSGLVADLPFVSALWVNNFSLICSGVCVFVTPFAFTYSTFVVISIFFGFFVSAFIALTSIILVDFIGLRLLTNSFGLLCIFRGVAGIVGPPVAGSIYDATQSYDVSFYVAGILLFICAALHCIIPCIQKCCPCHTGPVRYTTNEDYLNSIPEEEEVHGSPTSPDATDGAGIVLDIRPKRGSLKPPDNQDVIEEEGEEEENSKVGSSSV